jgi:hypothetical protein
LIYCPNQVVDDASHAPPEEVYISDPTFDRMYSMKSSLGCLFGAVQCISATVMSCMRLQNGDTVHTMDVLPMYTSYLLLCDTTTVLPKPVYDIKPIICILGKKKLKKKSKGHQWIVLSETVHPYLLVYLLL